MALHGFTSSTTDYLYRPLSWPTRGPRPWFYSVWVNYGSFSGITGPLQFTNVAELSQNAAPRVGLRNTGSASGWLGADQDDGGGNGNLTPTFTATAGQWFHHATNLSGQASREYFFGGVSKGVSATSIGTQTLQALQVGFGIGGSLPSNAAVAEIVVGNGILSKDQVAALAAGRNPLSVLNPAQIVCYYPLRGDITDYGPNGPVGLIPTGANASAAVLNGWVAHPPVAIQPSRRLFSGAASGNTAAAGSGIVGPLLAAGSATQTNAATGAGTLSLTAAGTGTQTNAATGTGVLGPIVAEATALSGSAAIGNSVLVLSAAGSGTQTNAAAGVGTLGPLQASGTAANGGAATGTGLLGPLTAAATATQSNAATGAGAISLQAAGAGSQTNAATGAATLGPLQAAGTASAGAAATGVGVLGLVASGTASFGNVATGSAVFSFLAVAAASQINVAAGTAIIPALRAAGAAQGVSPAPATFEAGRVATIRADSRMAFIPPDSRTAYAPPQLAAAKIGFLI